MPAKLVNPIRTKYTTYEFIKGLIEAWLEIYGVYPTKEQIGVIFSQWSHETGNGNSFWNNNVGNIKFVPSKNPDDDNDKEYMMLSNVWEMINGKKEIFNPPHPQTWFRSFKSLKHGLIHHLQFLSQKRFAKAWQAVKNGNPIEFAVKLKEQRYYTDSIENYSKALQRHFDKFMKNSMFEQALNESKKESNVDDDITEPFIPITVSFEERKSYNELVPLKLSFWNKILAFIMKLFKL